MIVTARRRLWKLAACAACASMTAAARESRAECGRRGGRDVLVTATVGAAVGITAALGSSAIAATAGSARNYRFYLGAAVGGGVTLGLGTLYGLFDYFTGCHMVNDSRSRFVWSVPIVTFIVGAALPVAIWGAARQKNASAADAQALSVGLGGAF